MTPNGLLPNEGIGAQLGYILSAPIVGVLPWELRLWVNDLVPDSDTVLSDLIEASWIGYHPVALDRSVWTTPTVTDGCARSTYGTDPIAWVCEDTIPQTNYGVAYIDRSASVIRWIQRFNDGDIRPTEPGQAFKLLPEYTLTSAACRALTTPRGTRAAQRRKGIK